jgi:hypothetical protein
MDLSLKRSLFAALACRLGECCFDLPSLFPCRTGFPPLGMLAAIIAFSPVILFAADEKPTAVVNWIHAAEKSDQLKVDFYDPNTPPKAYPGWTDFELSLSYKFRHQTRWKIGKGNAYTVTIHPSFTSVKTAVKHVVQLPNTIDQTRWQDSILGRHELDHVAIGSHPRLLMLTSHLVKNLKSVNRKANRVADVTNEWAQAAITAEIDLRRLAIQQLITANNVNLDLITRHGGETVPDREAFFDRLFLKENLDELKFLYLGESHKLLETDEYRQAKSLFHQQD